MFTKEELLDHLENGTKVLENKDIRDAFVAITELQPCAIFANGPP